MKHLTQFEVDGKYYFDESVYEIGDYAVVIEEGSVWPVGTVIRCLEEAKNGLSAYFKRKMSKEEALQLPEYIEPLWVYNSKMLTRYSKQGYQIRNRLNTTIPQDILTQLVKFYCGKLPLYASNHKELRVDKLFHTGRWDMLQIDNCDLLSQMYEKVPIESITIKIINKEYGKQHTDNTTGHDNNVLRSTATIVQGEYPTGRSYSARCRAKITI